MLRSHLPSIPAEAYASRRQSLLSVLEENSLVVLPAKSRSIRNGDTHYPFRQASDFYYLTGIEEPDAILVIDKSTGQSCLFSASPNPEMARWEGAQLGEAGALAQGIDAWKRLEEWEQALASYLKQGTVLYYDLGKHPKLDHILLRCLSVQGTGRQGPIEWQLRPLAGHLARLRTEKSPLEIACLKQAIDISIQGHHQIMQALPKAEYEYELAARFIGSTLEQGATGMAYPPIVASAERACILHYTQNHHPLSKDKLILVDAGAEYQGYAADLTRTYPISGRYDSTQALLYDIVLQAQTTAIEMLKPGVTWPAIQSIVIKTLVEGLLAAQILKGSAEALIETQAYKAFYMHGCGHWLGLDVHDAGPYQMQNGQDLPLKANQVLTIEPGVYFDTDNQQVPAAFRGIGIRIEDNIVITSTGADVLSQALPRTRAEIEATMAV